MMKLLAIVALLGAVALVEADPKPFNPFTVEHKDPMYKLEYEIFFPPYKMQEPEELLAKVDKLQEFYRERAGDPRFARDDIGREIVRDVGKLSKIGHISAGNCDDLASYNKLVDDWYESRHLLSAQKFFQHFRAEQNKLCGSQA